jgi:hypothetical protein
LPNVEEQGLRIERWDMKQTNEPNTINFSLLLTQVVEKHQYLQGGVEIIIVGNTQEGERSLALQELRDDKQNSIRFRFRYFQNIDGELRVPKGFEPRQVMVIAKSTGGNNQRLEKKFDWQLDGD